MCFPVCQRPHRRLAYQLRPCNEKVVKSIDIADLAQWLGARFVLSHGDPAGLPSALPITRRGSMFPLGGSSKSDAGPPRGACGGGDKCAQAFRGRRQRPPADTEFRPSLPAQRTPSSRTHTLHPTAPQICIRPPPTSRYCTHTRPSGPGVKNDMKYEYSIDFRKTCWPRVGVE